MLEAENTTRNMLKPTGTLLIVSTEGNMDVMESIGKRWRPFHSVGLSVRPAHQGPQDDKACVPILKEKGLEKAETSEKTKDRYFPLSLLGKIHMLGNKVRGCFEKYWEQLFSKLHKGNKEEMLFWIKGIYCPYENWERCWEKDLGGSKTLFLMVYEKRKSLLIEQAQKRRFSAFLFSSSSLSILAKAGHSEMGK